MKHFLQIGKINYIIGRRRRQKKNFLRNLQKWQTPDICHIMKREQDTQEFEY